MLKSYRLSILLASLLAVFAICESITQPAHAEVASPTLQFTETTYAPGLIASAGQVTTTVTLATVNLGDWCFASLSVSTAGTVVSCAVTAANTIVVTVSNTSGAGVTLASSLLRVYVVTHPPYLR